MRQVIRKRTQEHVWTIIKSSFVFMREYNHPFLLMPNVKDFQLLNQCNCPYLYCVWRQQKLPFIIINQDKPRKWNLETPKTFRIKKVHYREPSQSKSYITYLTLDKNVIAKGKKVLQWSNRLKKSPLLGTSRWFFKCCHHNNAVGLQERGVDGDLVILQTVIPPR